jgi:exopolyphosphatase/guanosine-5'-triphosphate,3'-diphosphate pyrophosphatase
MIVAAIDIGSNAARLYICRFFPQKQARTDVKVLEFVRIPLRLGEDVFKTGMVEAAKADRILEIFKVFAELMQLFGVQDYRACATSALREAINAREICANIEKSSGIKLDVISGAEEARLIYSAHFALLESEKNVLLVDVGGGSTEISLLNGNTVRLSQSFEVGAVRLLQGERSTELVLQEMKQWVRAQIRVHSPKYILGTGGNINKVFDLLEMKKGKFATRKQLDALQGILGSLTLKQRMELWGLNADRADIILPACTLYSQIMKASEVNKITVSGLGLKDGIISDLLERHHSVPVADFHANERFFHE